MKNFSHLSLCARHIGGIIHSGRIANRTAIGAGGLADLLGAMTKRGYFKAAGHVVLGTVVASLGLALSSFASTTPFNEDFEGFSHNQDVDGSNGWETKAVGSATDITGVALAQSNVVYSGARSLVVTNADLLNDFSDDKTNIWTEIYTRPVFGQQADVPADASVVFYINSTGTVVAFSNTVAVPLDHTPIASNTFVRFRAHTDHAAETYDLYLGSTKIADTFGFYSAVNADYNTFMVRAGSGTNGMYLDDIEIFGVSPFFQIVSNPAVGVSVQDVRGRRSAGRGVQDIEEGSG